MQFILHFCEVSSMLFLAEYWTSFFWRLLKQKPILILSYCNLLLSSNCFFPIPLPLLEHYNNIFLTLLNSVNGQPFSRVNCSRPFIPLVFLVF